MVFRTQKVEDAMVMMIEGKLLSEQETTPMREQISSELETGTKKFIFDLKGIEFVNSACLNFLMSARKLVSEKDGKIVLCNVPDQLKKLLSVTKLESFFIIAGRTEEAMTMLRSKES
ncbi:MAG TPA: STAS domain-containing protein [Chitinophagales bacterium]|nr:STAS domain-containing protein [Chitinophagales bacterium]